MASIRMLINTLGFSFNDLCRLFPDGPRSWRLTSRASRTPRLHLKLPRLTKGCDGEADQNRHHSPIRPGPTGSRGRAWRRERPGLLRTFDQRSRSTVRASLTIAAVAPQDRTDVGCAHCRATTARWNEQMRLVARERLSELSARLKDPPTSIRYLAACGPTTGVLAQASEQYEIDMIVLPWRPAERVRRLLRVSVPEQLGRQRRWEIIVAPRAATFARAQSRPAPAATLGAQRTCPRAREARGGPGGQP